MKKYLILSSILALNGTKAFAQGTVSSGQPVQTPPGMFQGNLPSSAGDDDKKQYELRLKMGRMTWNAEQTALVVNATPEEYKHWVWEIFVAPTRSATITAPFEDDIVEVSLGNPGAFTITKPSDGSSGYFFLMPTSPNFGLKTSMTIMFKSGVRVTFSVTVGRIETAVVNVDLQVLGREKIDPWIQKRVAWALAKVDETMRRRERELDAEAASRANSTLLKNIIMQLEVKNLARTNRASNIILRTVSKARIGNWIYLRFLVKNNSDNGYDFSKAQIDVVRLPTGITSIFSSAEETRQPLANQIYFVENPRIPAGEERYGVLGFPIPEEWKSGDIFDITVFENGLQRNITVTDIDLAWD